MAEHDLHSIAFPTLSDAQVAELERCTGASLERHEDGETLIDVGDRDFQFHVVKTGAIEILDVSGDTPKTITEVKRMHGDGTLAAVEIRNSRTGEETRLEVAGVFSFIGAVPRTDWLPNEIETDSRGFVLTGSAVKPSPRDATRRTPFLLETSQRGVFAAGDVRSGSVKRVASAVGEGSMAIQFVHEYLKEM